MEKAWEGMVPAPNVEELTADVMNNPGKKTGRLVGYIWRCTKCGRSLSPAENFLANLQAFKCISCNIENQTSYFWSMTKCVLNDVNLNFKIYEQEKDQCILYALLAACDLARRIRGARHGFIESNPFSPSIMLKYFEEVNGYDLPKGPDDDDEAYYTMEHVMRTAYLRGVPYSDTTYDANLSLPPDTARRNLKIKSWFRIPAYSTEKITRLLANGTPLIGTFIDGKLFTYVNERDIYLAPISYETGHEVMLHGSGLAVGNHGSRDGQGSAVPTEHGDGKHGTFYNCRNSHGDDAHASYEQKGRGGDFSVWASDLIGYVYGLNLADDDDDDLQGMEGSSRSSALVKMSSSMFNPNQLSHQNVVIKTLRIKPFTETFETIELSIGTTGQIIRQKVYEEMGTRILDLEFQSREEAKFVMDVFASRNMYNIVWAPSNLSALRTSNTKVEYQEIERDKEKEEEDFTDEDEDY